MLQTSIMSSSTAVVLGRDSYGQEFLVQRDRYGCELDKRVFIGSCSSLASRIHQEDALIARMTLLDIFTEEEDEYSLDSWEF